MTVPETSCSRVVPAKDYGVAEDRYLSPKGTVFNKDTKGLFAPDGTYYPLQKVDDKYFSRLVFYLYNYKKYFENKKGRNSKKNTKNK